MSRSRLCAALLAAGLLAAGGPVADLPSRATAQIPLSPVRDAGQSVTPAYEGWYPNPDGTFTLSFGYFNRNREESLDIPVGPNNFMQPGRQDLGQPTRFDPQRHWGVFTVKVPADFGDAEVVWTLVNRGQTFAIPGHLQADWLLDAKLNPASGNTPPALKFAPWGPEGRGPDGITAGPIAAKVGDPVSLTLWVRDDEIGRENPFRRQPEPVMLMWLKHSGPGDVAFENAEPPVDKEDGGKSSTSATFSAPGAYVLRVRANDLSGNVSGGHAQCCWTNGYVKVEVTE